MGEGGLAGGGRPGDHHEAHLPPGGDPGGDVPDLLLHHGLIAEYERRGLPLGDGVVQLRHVGHAQGLRALGGAVKLPEHLQGGLEVPQAAGILQGGQAEDEAVLKQLQPEAADVAGVRHHVAVEVVHEAVQLVHVHMGVHPEAEQLGLVHQPLPAEQLHGVVGVEGTLLNGQGGGGHLPHTGLHPVQQGLVQGKAPLGAEEQGAAEGVVHGQAVHVFRARHIVERLDHQEHRAALVGLDAGYVPGGDQAQGAVPVQRLVKLAQLAVPVHQQNVVGIPVLEVGGDAAEGGAAGVIVPHAVDRYRLFLHCSDFHGNASLSFCCALT